MAILINDTAPRNQYTATSGQTVFTVSFEFFENADLKVYKNAALQTITTHYTVTGAGVTGGGSITLTSGATAGDIITIVRDIPVKRVTDFPTSGPFNISALNTELDKIVAMVQEREDDITRVVQLSDTDTSTSLTLPIAASRASKVLGFDATGNAIVMQELGNYRGNWAASTAYVLRDIVKDTSNANIYICVQAHTSSGSQPLSTNPNAASWALLVDAATATSASSSASASASAAASSASAASGSASSASTSASNASTSATNASNSASSASTSATNAANSASSASTSATNAANSATSASGSAATATTQASNAASSASSAASSASTATTQAGNASTSASNAASSASSASTSASNASTSASNAASSASSAASAQSAAESARDATLAAYDSFDDRYLGAKTSNPALDNDGNALVAGALYFNSVAGEMRLYTGSAWVAAYVSGSGFLPTSGGTITGDLIVNASGSTDGVRITQTGTGNALVVEDSANPDATPFVVDASGNVGIGTSSPGNKLDIVSAGSSQIRVKDGVNATAYYDFGRDGVDGFFGFSGAQTTFSGYKWSVNAGSEVMRITNGGNVGIGTSSPASKLSVSSASSVQMQATTGTVDFRIQSIDANAAAYSGTVSNHAYAFTTNNSERARIDSSGNVGIGTSSPGSALDVKGTLRLSGATSGYVGLAPAAAAGSTTYTLPAADGSSGQVLSTNGSGTLSWASATATGTLKNVQVFTSSGTYTRTAGVTTAVVIAVGGGGGGRGASGKTAGGNGGNGGTTSFGAHVSAAGGSGCTGTTGGAGGTGGTGATIAIKGQGGGSGLAYSVAGGNVGSFGGIGGGQGGGSGVRANTAGNAGVRGGGGSGGADTDGTPCAEGSFSGGGGGQGETCIDYITTVGATETVTIGAGGTAGTGTRAGGAGGAGYIIVYEYS